jgi:ribose transport system ATP-binding protein
MATEADILLLDDPTRGVDVATKTQIYQVFKEAASEGRLVVWRTSDDRELELCSRLIVMNSGQVAAEFNTSEVSHAGILEAAFKPHSEAEKHHEGSSHSLPLWFFAMVAAVLLFGICGYMSPRVLSKFGIELLAVGFTPFVFAALSQTFIIGLGHIDLSVGAFMGLVNVLCATILNQNTAFGLLAILAVLLIYSMMGLVVYFRRIPSIIVTLGMSFVWIGTAFILQDMPGGHTPDWLVKVVNFNNPIIEGVLFYLVLFIIGAIVIYRSRYGTVLRGFGNNDVAVVNSGWSKGWAHFMIYLISGIFATMGGIAFSAITGASDVSASSTFTMLTIAAVIIGGGYFSGGVVTHVGAVLGAISLTMISVLLGMLNISNDYTATIQGLVLLVILSLRIIKKGGAAIND